MIDGFDDLNRLAADLTGAAASTVARASLVVDKVAHDIEGSAKQLVPVDTGATKNSIGVDRPLGSDLEAIIGPTTEYAPYLEFGTATMAPHAFMGPAMDLHTPGFVAAMGQLGGDIL